MIGYVFGAIFIIAYLIWTYDAVEDMYLSYKDDSSVDSSTAMWIAATLLTFIMICTFN